MLWAYIYFGEEHPCVFHALRRYTNSTTYHLHLIRDAIYQLIIIVSIANTLALSSAYPLTWTGQPGGFGLGIHDMPKPAHDNVPTHYPSITTPQAPNLKQLTFSALLACHTLERRILNGHSL
jgi:hypothetical protein